MLRLELTQSLRHLVRQILENLANLSEFLVWKHVTQSEMILYLFTVGRGVWYAMYGVEGGRMENIAPARVWVAVFCGLATFKTVGFFSSSETIRIFGVVFSCILWTFLAGLALFSDMISPALPTYSIMAVSSLLIAVRLLVTVDDE